MTIFKIFIYLYLIPSIILITIGLLTIASIVASSGISKTQITSIIMGNIGQEETVLIVKNIFDSIPVATLAIAIAVLILLFLIYLIFNLLTTLSFFQVAFSKKNNISFYESFYKGKKYFWKIVGLTLLMIILLTPLFMLFIIPGIIFMVFWTFAIYIIIDKDSKITDSLTQSYHMVKRRWWRTFGIILLFIIISTIVSFILQQIPIIGGTLPTLIIAPITIIFFKNFYLDMKNKR